MWGSSHRLLMRSGGQALASALQGQRRSPEQPGGQSRQQRSCATGVHRWQRAHGPLQKQVLTAELKVPFTISSLGIQAWSTNSKLTASLFQDLLGPQWSLEEKWLSLSKFMLDQKTGLGKQSAPGWGKHQDRINWFYCTRWRKHFWLARHSCTKPAAEKTKPEGSRKQSQKDPDFWVCIS